MEDILIAQMACYELRDHTEIFSCIELSILYLN